MNMTSSIRSLTKGKLATGVRQARCVALTATGKRCCRRTRCSDKCTQHLELLDGLRIAPSLLAGAGLGLFTTVARSKGQRIVQYAGKHVQLDPSKAESEAYGGVYVLEMSQSHFIDASSPVSGAGRYSNTARAWNVARGECRGNNAHFTLDRRGRGTAWITATKALQAGDEVLTAYGRQYRIPYPPSASD